MFGLNLAPAVYAVLAFGVMVAVYYVTDKIGDYREAQVYERINRAIDGFNDETNVEAKKDSRALAVAEKMRTKTLESFKPGTGGVELTEDEATALGKIK